MISQNKLSIAAAAMAGLIAGAASMTSAATPVVTAPTSSSLVNSVSHQLDARLGSRNLADTGKTHDCKGKNACKGQGGCKTDDNSCKGKNACKGKGGCKTSSMPAKLMANKADPGQSATRLADTAKHDCKGMNACKGQGGCKTGDNGCKGKNSCKGKGGCKTNAMPSKL